MLTKLPAVLRFLALRLTSTQASAHRYTTQGTQAASEPIEAKQCPVWSCNEWDPLEEIIVGDAENGTVPKLLPEVKACVGPANWSFFEREGGKLWADAIPTEHWKALQQNVTNFVKVLENEGVNVKRPTPQNFSVKVTTPTFSTSGMYCAMPRDLLLIVGNEIIESTMTWRSRYFEHLSYRPLIMSYWRQGANWTAAPKPGCGPLLIDDEYDFESEKQRSHLAQKNRFVTTEYEPCFDAADFIRAGLDIFCQRSQVTNRAGIEWLRRHLAPKGIEIHELTFDDPRPMHVDATFSFVKPGLAIQNPDRPCHQADLFRAAGWKVVTSPMPQMSSDHPMWLGSKWLSMNTLMLDENRVIVEENETDLQEFYRSLGITPIPVAMRFANSIGGGFHCWTVDVRRRGKLLSYFNWPKKADV